MIINRLSIHYFLTQLFCLYDGRFDYMPEVTLEGFRKDINNMKAIARRSNELLELKIAIDYLLDSDWDSIKDFIPRNDYFEDEEEVKALLQIIRSSDWHELEDIPDINIKLIKFIDIPLMEWRSKRIKANQKDS